MSKHQKAPSWKRIAALTAKLERCVIHEIIEEIEELFDRWERGRHHHAHHLRLTFKWCGISIQGDRIVISEPLTVGQSVQVSGSPVKADQSASTATLSNVQYASSDPTVFTVAPDPTVANGGIITSVAPGSATITETATATEPDGTTTEVITGSATIIVSPAIPTPEVAAALVLNFGTPFPTPPPVATP